MCSVLLGLLASSSELLTSESKVAFMCSFALSGLAVFSYLVLHALVSEV